MKKIAVLILLSLSISSCVKIPQESIDLSKAIGQDLSALHASHRQSVKLIYSKIQEDINTFIDEVYAPFIINYVLSSELKSYNAGNESIFKSLNDAAQTATSSATDKALQDVNDFQLAAYRQISKKRKELLEPIEKEEADVLRKIDDSYTHIIHANSTVTGYLESVKKVRDAQKEGLRLIGLEDLDDQVTDRLISISGTINSYVNEAKEIDLKSDDALKKIEELSQKIKEYKNN